MSGDKHPPSLSLDLLAELPHIGRKPRGAAHTGSLPDEERGGGGWRSIPGIQEWARVCGGRYLEACETQRPVLALAVDPVSPLQSPFPLLPFSS